MNFTIYHELDHPYIYNPLHCVFVTTQGVQSAVHNCIIEIYFGHGLVNTKCLGVEVKKKITF